MRLTAGIERVIASAKKTRTYQLMRAVYATYKSRRDEEPFSTPLSAIHSAYALKPANIVAEHHADNQAPNKAIQRDLIDKLTWDVHAGRAKESDTVYFDGKTYTTPELVQQVKDMTPVGRRFYDLHQKILAESWHPDPAILDELVAHLQRKDGDGDIGLLAVGERTYSTNEIIEEVRAGTRFGKEFYNTNLSLLRRLEKLPKKK